MDETCIYLDAPSNYTIEVKGAKRVKANTTGSERTRLSALFTASAKPEKLPVMILVPRKEQLKDFIPPENTVIVYKTGATFNEETIIEHKNRILTSYMLTNNISDVTLLLDSAKCHQTRKVQDEYNGANINLMFIPPRMTNLVQPADVSWFASIKNEYHKKWNEWFLHTDKTFTRFGNMKSPGYATCIQWISKIWEDFDLQLIQNSFHHCGILSQTTQ
ncbi:pogo transposable element with KRAB domain-like [Brachionus plicatilis]|uniref:Pogo transposable element with KRAB domain-like n=1 Tax=Brachionus plicatilis TaxID=10195 RepID=A0A3M7P7Z1_BRAPC|nr:pogo transposable element with KRAB domain-like [Brachionus plicatilis]